MKKIFTFIVILVSAQCLLFAADSYYFQRAEEAYEKKDLDLCLKYCQEGVKENEKDGKCWAVIAEIYSKRAYARYGQALQAAEKALKTLPKKDTYWRAFVYNIQGNVFYKIEDLPSAKQAYLEAVKLMPDNTSFLYELADVCNDLKHYDEAITYYKRILEISPRTVYVYGTLAYAYYRSGNTEEAKRYCNLTDALADGENNMAHQLRSKMAFDEGNLALACREAVTAMFGKNEWCEEADTLIKTCPDLLMAAVRNEVMKAPTSESSNAMAAFCSYKLNRFMETLYYLHKKLEQTEEPQNVYPELATLYEFVDGTEDTERYYALVLKNDTSALAWEQYAGSLYHKADFAKAEWTYRRALEKAPTNGMHYYWIARCRYQQEDYTAALQALDTAQVLVDDNEQLSVLLMRAEIYRSMEQEDKVKPIVEQLLRSRKPDDHRYQYFYAYALAGNTDALVSKIDSVQKNNPEDLIALANAFALMKDKEHVLDVLKRHYESGFWSTIALRNSKRYAFLRGDADFEALLTQVESNRATQLEKLRVRLGNKAKQQAIAELPFTQQGGVCRVQCAINGLPLFFVFDTGAADVSISSVEANFMLKNGYLTNADFMGKQNYVTATGEIHEGTIINLREVRVGDVVLRDIKASVIKNQSAPLLLGQTCFRRFGTVEVDNNAQVIRLFMQ